MRKKIAFLIATIATLITAAIPASSFAASNQLSAPKNISFSNISSTSVDLTWNPVSHSSGYLVSFYNEFGRAFATLRTNVTAATSLATETLLSPLTRYRVSVRTLGSGYYSNSPESGKVWVTTVDYAAPQTIASSSTIANGASNPSVIVTGNDFRSGVSTSDLSVDLGATGLTYASVTRNSSTQITLNFTGTAAQGTIAIAAKATAFVVAPAATSNQVSITVPAGGPVPFVTDGDFSIEFWLKPTAGFLDGQRNEVFNLSGSCPVQRFDIWYTQGDGGWSIYANGLGGQSFDTNPPVIGTWTQIALKRSGGTISVYKDAVFKTSFTFTADLTDCGNLLMGQDPYYWANTSRAGDSNAILANARIVNGSAITPTLAASSKVSGTSFYLSDLIASPNQSLVLSSSSYFSFTVGDSSLTQLPVGGSPLFSTDAPTF